MEAGGEVSVDVAIGVDDNASVGLAEGAIVSLLEGVTEGVRVEGMAVSWRAGSLEAASVANASVGVGVRLELGDRVGVALAIGAGVKLGSGDKVGVALAIEAEGVSEFRSVCVSAGTVEGVTASVLVSESVGVLVSMSGVIVGAVAKVLVPSIGVTDAISEASACKASKLEKGSSVIKKRKPARVRMRAGC